MRYNIEEICQMPEGQTFDCKSIHIEPKALANTIVAMANADGGMIAVGISDKTRRVEGVDQDKAHLNEILRTPFDFCVPTISVTTEFMPCQDSEGNDNHILIIHVPASPRLHANQADEAFWRVGDKSRKLPFEERLQLMYDKGERYYEDSPAYDATIEDIDMDAVKAYMKRIGYGKSPMEYLQENKGFLTYKGDVPQVSTACILLFGKRPQNFFPRARVRFIKYYGIGRRTRKRNNGARKGQEKGTKRAQKRHEKGHEKVIALIKDNPQISIPTLANDCNMSVKSMRLLLNKLKAANTIVRIGPAKGGYWKVLSDEISD